MVRNKARAAGAEGWLRGLPNLVAFLEHERAVLVHGDVHQWNALRAGDGFRLVDPDGLPLVGREMLAAADYVCGA